MTLRLGLVGCGAIARRAHLPAFKKAGTVDVVAFASRTRASAEAASQEWGGGEVHDDWRELVERTDIDAVDICTINSLHAPVAVAAARSAKHVLVEKPMACTVAEADDMVDAAAASGVVLMAAHNVRFAPPFTAARRAMERVGRPVGVRAAFGHAGPKGWAPESTWFFVPELAGGGALIDLGIHMIDTLRYVLGDEIVEVGALLLPGADGEVEQAAQVVLRFGGGAIGSLHASWAARPGPDHQLTVFGTDGTLHLDGRTPLTFVPAGGGKPEPVDLEPAASPYAAFADAVAGGVPPPVTGEDGRAAVAVVEAAYQSARSGSFVAVQPPRRL